MDLPIFNNKLELFKSRYSNLWLHTYKLPNLYFVEEGGCLARVGEGKFSQTLEGFIMRHCKWPVGLANSQFWTSQCTQKRMNMYIYSGFKYGNIN